jgi:hypothetical protein
MHCSPDEDGDEAIRQLVNAHQATDKGFGPALGPAATGAAAECFGALGYSVEREASDWHLGPGEAELQRQLIAGWADAAAQIAPDRADTIDTWRARRLGHVDGGRSHIVVGHDDLAVWLPGR